MKIFKKLLAAVSFAVLVALVVSVCVTYADVKSGDQGQQVKEVQYVLISHGYVGVGPADGIFGPKTDAGVRKWQRVNGLVVDGVVGPVTLASLLGSVSAPAASQPAKRLTPPQPQPAMSVQDIIRDVWPDDLEDWALRIAKRESNYVPTVRNWCCIGLFQIFWTTHRHWLCPDLGICDLNQLFDPRTNAEAALALYQRNGPGPWQL